MKQSDSHWFTTSAHDFTNKPNNASFLPRLRGSRTSRWLTAGHGEELVPMGRSHQVPPYNDMR
jgi:hypothetical protein